MAPTGEDLVETLKSTVDKLEARVAELEGRLRSQATSGGSSGSKGSDGMRMILIGPPGAGESNAHILATTAGGPEC